MKRDLFNKCNNDIKVVILFIVTVVVFIFFVINNSDNSKKVISSDKVIVLNDKTEEFLDIESYILGVLANEAPLDYSLETLKALAVVIRSYIVLQIGDKMINDNEKYIFAEDMNLPYMKIESVKDVLGEKIYKENIGKYEKAIEETKGEVILYNEQIITPLYHYVSAGCTRDGKDIFGEDTTYLKSVGCPLDVECEEYLQIKECLKKDFYTDFEIVKKDEYGYVLEVDVGNDIISGEEFAKQEGLNSSCFSVQEVGENIKIVVKGKGHGFGMSLFGAERLARQQYKYEKILKYFYSDIEIVKIVE